MKKFGFTLAEVLITLGVIGVVAAITMPTLIKNYQKHVWYNQFRKAASMLENAVKMYEVDNGCIGNVLQCTNRLTSADLIKYFNVAVKINEENQDKYNKNYVNWDCTSDPCAFITNDGMLFNLFVDGGLGDSGLLDINGPEKGPNTYDRDVFIFYAPGYNPFLRDMFNLPIIVWGGNESRFSNEIEEIGDLPCIPSKDSDTEGGGCAAKLLRDGKMDY